MTNSRYVFLGLCSVLTGYSHLELEGTGLVDSYQELLEKVLGPALSSELYSLAEELVQLSNAADREQKVRDTLLPPSIFWPVISSLIALWYLGNWNQLSDTWYAAAGLPVPGPNEAGFTHTPSELAYIEQLSYRAAEAHPPGAKPTGFGSWSRNPSIEAVSGGTWQ